MPRRVATLFPGERVVTAPAALDPDLANGIHREIAESLGLPLAALTFEPGEDWIEVTAQRAAELRAISRLAQPRRRKLSSKPRKVATKTRRGLRYRAAGK